MIEKLKLESYIPESLIVHIYSDNGVLHAERYDTIYWVREKYPLVAVKGEVDCYVDVKKLLPLIGLAKEIEIVETNLVLTLFNGAHYELAMISGELPTFEIPELKNKTKFDFGGVEKAVATSPLQKELNMVYVDNQGVVASNSIVGGINNVKFKSETPFTVPEGIHAMLNGAEASWDIIDGLLYVVFSNYAIVAVLSKIEGDFKWWEFTRAAFDNLPEFVEVTGLKGSISRLAAFGDMVLLKDGKFQLESGQYEPFVLQGNSEWFDVNNLGQVISDDKIGVALHGGNLFIKKADSLFVCCSVDRKSSK